MLIMVTCWLVIYGCQPCNQEITEFVKTRDAAGIHLVRDGRRAVLCPKRKISQIIASSCYT